MGGGGEPGKGNRRYRLAIGRVESYLYEKLETQGALHLTLIDPDKTPGEEAGRLALKAEEYGTDAIMVGGSIGVSGVLLDQTVKAIKELTSLPVILFPSNISGISSFADAIFFMSLLNSEDPYYLIGAQMLGAPIVKRLRLEPIPMSYIIVEPGGAAGYVGRARPVPRDKPEIAAAYALAGQYLGARFTYLEAGSGAPEPIPPKMVKLVRAIVNTFLIVGGGVKKPEQAKQIVEAGADAIVTGTIIEESPKALAKVIKAIKETGKTRIFTPTR